MAIGYKRITATTASLVALYAAISSCTKDVVSPVVRTFRGPQVSMGAGMAWSEMVFDSSDQLQSLTVVFNASALNNLPATLPNTEFIIPMPTQAPASVFNHIGINYNPNGHPPPAVYTVPHFDVHYYLISLAARDAITAADADFATKAVKAPSAAESPLGYVADAFSIPRMGTHWSDANSHEFHGEAFTKTLIYGFYDAKMIFIEPMFTKAYLETHPNETSEIRAPTKYPSAGRYPTSYRIAFDAALQEYRVELATFASRN